MADRGTSSVRPWRARRSRSGRSTRSCSTGIVGTEEWRGRSGGYAIQGAGAALALRVDGEVENVVGLPLATLLDIYPELLADPRAAGEPGCEPGS